jgi:hypothetical protein
MGSAPFVEVNVVPICHLKTMKSVPEKEFVMRIHRHFGRLSRIGRNLVICHRMDLSICNGSRAAVIGLLSFPAKPEIRNSGVDFQRYVAFVIEAVGTSRF